MGAEEKNSHLKGWVFLALWAILIIVGIIGKRVYGHPDLMVFFHLPAAVFLVLSGYELSRNVREKHREEIRKLLDGMGK